MYRMASWLPVMVMTIVGTSQSRKEGAERVALVFLNSSACEVPTTGELIEEGASGTQWAVKPPY